MKGKTYPQDLKIKTMKVGNKVRRNNNNWIYDNQDVVNGKQVAGVVRVVVNTRWVTVEWRGGMTDNYLIDTLKFVGRWR